MDIGGGLGMEFGVFKGKSLIEKCSDETIGKRLSLDLTKQTGEIHICRKLHFDELAETEKFFRLKDRLDELNKFLNNIKGSGRTYRSDTSIYADELEWLLKMAEKQLQIKY